MDENYVDLVLKSLEVASVRIPKIAGLDTTHLAVPA
jgi:hypothetical protein